MSELVGHVEITTQDGMAYVVRETGPFAGKVAVQPVDGDATRYALSDPKLDAMAKAAGFVDVLAAWRAAADAEGPADPKDAEIAALRRQLAAKPVIDAGEFVTKADLEAFAQALLHKQAPGDAGEPLIRPDAGAQG